VCHRFYIFIVCLVLLFLALIASIEPIADVPLYNEQLNNLCNFQMFPLKLLTFDLINTLVKVRIHPALQYAAVARAHGLDVKEVDVTRVYQATWRQKVGIIFVID